MTTPPGPYGAYPPVPQRPKKYRPSAAWFVVGIGLILAAVAVAIGVFVWLFAGFLSTDATLRADGQLHRVSVGSGGERMLWLENDEIRCSITDTATDEPVGIRRVGGSFERSDSNGELEGLWRFDPGSGELTVACASSPLADTGTAETVLIGPMPEIDSLVVGILVMVFVPGLLGLAGLVILLWTGILWSLRDPKPKTA